MANGFFLFCVHRQLPLELLFGNCAEKKHRFEIIVSQSRQMFCVKNQGSKHLLNIYFGRIKGNEFCS